MEIRYRIIILLYTGWEDTGRFLKCSVDIIEFFTDYPFVIVF